MSARTGKRRQAGLSRERLIALLAVIVAVAVYFGLRNAVGSGESGCMSTAR